MIAISEPVSTILLQQGLHHDLRAGSVQSADHGQRQNPVPQFDDGRRQFQHFLLLPVNDLFAGFLESPHGVHPQFVEQLRSDPNLLA